MRGVVLVIAVVGCAEPLGSSAPAFTYTAEVVFDSPEIIAVSFDGTPIATRFEQVERFADLTEATGARHTVVVTTTSGAQTFQLAPTSCGGMCQTTCAEITSEAETWSIDHGQGPPPPPGTPFAFYPSGGVCRDAHGAGFGWAD